MTESERNLSHSHNPNLTDDRFEHLDEQNRVINLLNPHFECTDLPQSEADKLYDAHEHFRQLADGYDGRYTVRFASPTGYASKNSALKNCCSTS